MHLDITPYALPPQLGQWCKFRLQHFLSPQSKSGNGFRIVFSGVRFGLLMSYAEIHVGYTDLSVHIYILESIGSCPEKQHPRAWPPFSGLCPPLFLWRPCLYCLVCLGSDQFSLRNVSSTCGIQIVWTQGLLGEIHKPALDFLRIGKEGCFLANRLGKSSAWEKRKSLYTYCSWKISLSN